MFLDWKAVNEPDLFFWDHLALGLCHLCALLFGNLRTLFLGYGLVDSLAVRVGHGHPLVGVSLPIALGVTLVVGVVPPPMMTPIVFAIVTTGSRVTNNKGCKDAQKQQTLKNIRQNLRE